MSSPYGSGPVGSLRIGDAERIAAATALGDHFAAGRLDQVEFDQRLAGAYAARIFADLDPLFADLPEPRPAAPVPAAPPMPVRPEWPPPRVDRGPAWRGAWAVPAAVPLPVLLLVTFMLV